MVMKAGLSIVGLNLFSICSFYIHTIYIYIYIVLLVPIIYIYIYIYHSIVWYYGIHMYNVCVTYFDILSTFVLLFRRVK